MLVRQVVALLPADAVIELVADDTVDGKAGERVWAKSAHRDPIRSTASATVIKYGHKWLAMCVLVRLKGWDRPWALPVLCGLCVPPKIAGTIHRPAKTASQLTRQMLVRLMRWLPDRKFILTGDYQVVTHETVAFAQHHAQQVTVIGPPARGRQPLRAAEEPQGRLAHRGAAKEGTQAALAQDAQGSVEGDRAEAGVVWEPPAGGAVRDRAGLVV